MPCATPLARASYASDMGIDTGVPPKTVTTLALVPVDRILSPFMSSRFFTGFFAKSMWGGEVMRKRTFTSSSSLGLNFL